MLAVIVGLLVGALVCLVLSLVVHAAALLALPQPLGPIATWGLHLALIGVWMALLLVARRLGVSLDDRPLWQAARRQELGRARWLVPTAGWYAAAVMLATLIAPPRGGGANPPPEAYRVFSAVWVAGYVAAVEVAYVLAAGVRGAHQHVHLGGHRVVREP